MTLEAEEFFAIIIGGPNRGVYRYGVSHARIRNLRLVIRFERRFMRRRNHDANP